MNLRSTKGDIKRTWRKRTEYENGEGTENNDLIPMSDAM
jgi:hypothetical protein